jgi:PIN domain nuclease of toxin-antitoxin system
MELLLDTHAFLWWVTDAAALSKAARAVIANPANACRLSLASCWEMAIKISLGKLRLPSPLERFIPEQLAANGFALLDIDFGDAARVARLPFHHRDPFDRLLAAQALDGELAIVSADTVFRKYGIRRVWW